jgi:phage terminase large subunit
MLEYTPRSQFLPFHNRRQRWAVLNTHRRAGKTVALVNDVIVGSLQCPLRKPQHAYVGPTYTQAKRIAWAYLKDYAEPYLAKPPSESELKVTLHGDRTIYCLGADNPDSLRGMYLDGGVGDEYALFRPSTFSTIIRPALSDRNGWWVFASTPRGKNLFYAEYKKAIRNPKEYYNLTLRASESGLIHHLELEALRKDMDPEEYAQEYECSFDAALKGAIYAEEINLVFAEYRVGHDLYDPNLPTHVVFDLGFTDATVAIYWQEAPDGTIRIVNVDVTNGKDIFHHIDRINLFKGQADLGSVWLPHDAKAKNLQTGKSIVEQFLDNDIRPSIVPNHKVRDRIAATRAIFPRVHFEDDVSEDLLEALKGYRREWDENKLMFSDTPLHDWCSDYADAFGYMAVVAAPKYGSHVSADASPEALARNEKLLIRTAPSNYNLATLFKDREAQTRTRRIA